MAIETGFAVGTIMLLGALAYGMRQYARRDPRNEPLTDAATRAVYEREEMLEGRR